MDCIIFQDGIEKDYYIDLDTVVRVYACNGAFFFPSGEKRSACDVMLTNGLTYTILGVSRAQFIDMLKEHTHHA